MQKGRVKFILFIILWLSILDYLILTKSRLNFSLLNKLSEPFYMLFTGYTITNGQSSNNLFTLILINIIIALLFSMTYMKLEAQYQKKGSKRR